MTQAPLWGTPGLAIQPLSYQGAQEACAEYHYSGKAFGNIRFGIWYDGRFDGAILFGDSNQMIWIAEWWNTRLGKSAELTRIALRPQVEREYPTTQALSLAVRAMRKRGGLDSLWTYADGEQGHDGTVYRAASWLPCGQSDRVGFNRYWRNGKPINEQVARHLFRQGRGCDITRTKAFQPKFRFAFGLTRTGKRKVKEFSSQCEPHKMWS